MRRRAGRQVARDGQSVRQAADVAPASLRTRQRHIGTFTCFFPSPLHLRLPRAARHPANPLCHVELSGGKGGGRGGTDLVCNKRLPVKRPLAGRAEDALPSHSVLLPPPPLQNGRRSNLKRMVSAFDLCNVALKNVFLRGEIFWVGMKLAELSSAALPSFQVWFGSFRRLNKKTSMQTD